MKEERQESGRGLRGREGTQGMEMGGVISSEYVLYMCDVYRCVKTLNFTIDANNTLGMVVCPQGVKGKIRRWELSSAL